MLKLFVLLVFYLTIFKDYQVDGDVIVNVDVDVGRLIAGEKPEQADTKDRNCYDLLVDSNGTLESGYYTIYPYTFLKNPYTKPIEAYCDMDTDGGGWTVFQQRNEYYTLFFNETWTSYVEGFNNTKNAWLGLDNIYALTQQGNTDLRVDVVGFKGTIGWAVYSDFKIDNSLNKYTLHIGSYEGNMTDALRKHDGIKFSTFDNKNNGVNERNCGAEFGGGWWYFDCYNADLNSDYANWGSTVFPNGITTSQMKCRPSKKH